MSRGPRRVYPPVVYGSGLLVAFVAHLLLPLSLPPSPWTRVLGGVLLAAGMVLAGWAAATFNRARTPVHPFHEAAVLVTGGPFRYSRNPIYLGFTLVTLGVAGLAASWWPVIILPVVLVVMTPIIRWEEDMLRRVFTGEYAAYTARTRRWV